ncbi:MAG: type IV pilin-like G/H family protein [Nostoc sp. ZfuVER08]|uniref:Type IV pilin-like G/H family protein n=1 Tax=Nostoc punctiforme FACHB-252 TaxID=1357509 RepID=A0ABR8H5D3_NOSPU|nr:type IV pilin-like G/H family protein [Nostoc punctiforme]MBD2610734.1 type IV pilin-like G/H family protein [Nostoc punctiforme FACHB-252]MDZ8014808.1 type IV pilin-like G/H family protein [Nostoc sp. ZfuVER08]
MKSELKAKFLQHIIGKKKENEGFTLIELLVVIIIIGILSAIALPSFLNQANKGKQSEAKQYTGSMNRAQQAYYLENAKFTTDMDQLGLGIKTQTENYGYKVNGSDTIVANNGLSLKAPLKSYIGVTIQSQASTTSEATTLAALCESAAVGNRTSDLSAGLAGAVDGATPANPSCPNNFLPLTSK